MEHLLCAAGSELIPSSAFCIYPHHSPRAGNRHYSPSIHADSKAQEEITYPWSGETGAGIGSRFVRIHSPDSQRFLL